MHTLNEARVSALYSIESRMPTYREPPKKLAFAYLLEVSHACLCTGIPYTWKAQSAGQSIDETEAEVSERFKRDSATFLNDAPII